MRNYLLPLSLIGTMALGFVAGIYASPITEARYIQRRARLILDETQLQQDKQFIHQVTETLIPIVEKESALISELETTQTKLEQASESYQEQVDETKEIEKELYYCKEELSSLDQKLSQIQ